VISGKTLRQGARYELLIDTNGDARHAAAWTSYKNGRSDEAQRLIARALSLGTRDAKLSTAHA
jgi:hypothetical protein